MDRPELQELETELSQIQRARGDSNLRTRILNWFERAREHFVVSDAQQLRLSPWAQTYLRIALRLLVEAMKNPSTSPLPPVVLSVLTQIETLSPSENELFDLVKQVLEYANQPRDDKKQ